jgi:ribose transport system substrate-binding protein
MVGEVESRYFVESASKLLDVLESFSSKDEELSITEVGRRANLTYSSAFRLLYTLEKRGYVMRISGKKLYRLTPARRRFRIGYAGLQASRFQREVTWGILSAARKLAVSVVMRYNDEFNIAKALLNADRLLAEKIDLLIEYQFNETAGHVIGVKCQEAGVPCLAINVAQPGAYYFGGNNYLTGVLAGEFLSKYARTHWKGRAGKCIVVPGKGLGSTQESRIAGLRDSLRKGVPKLRASDILIAPAALSVPEAYSATRKVLAGLPAGTKHLLLAAITDPPGFGAEKALREVGLADDAVIIGHGGARDARRHIEARGPFRASVAFFPDSYGERILSLAIQVIEGEKVPLACYANHVVLTAENLGEYYPGEPAAKAAGANENSKKKQAAESSPTG